MHRCLVRDRRFSHFTVSKKSIKKVQYFSEKEKCDESPLCGTGDLPFLMAFSFL